MLGNSVDRAYPAENTVVSYDRRCLIEWNMNYYYDIDEPADALYGTTEKEFYKRFFPLKDVVKGWRPPSGAYRGRLGDFSAFRLQWPTAGDRSNLAFSCGSPVENTYTPKPRLYLALDNSEFKYYTTPLTIGHALYEDPYIQYTSNNVYANKVVVTFQRAGAIPKNFSVQIENSGGWTTIGSFSNVSAVSADGTVALYYNGTSWSTTQPAENLLTPENTTNVRGIKVIVTSMGNSSNVTLKDSLSYVSIIEMSARALLSFTDRLQSWDWTSNLAEEDTILPIGSMSANSGSVTLNNNDGLLDPVQGLTSPSYSYFMRKYGKVQVAYKASIGGSSWVNQFTGYIEKPESSGVYETVSLPLFDKLMFAKDIKAHDLLLKNHSISAIIYTLLDLGGLGPIKIKHSGGQEPKLTFFYSNQEESVFDAIQELCRAHQYAVTVDEDDNIVIMTSNYIFDNNRASQYVLTTEEVTSGGVDYKPNVYSYDDSEREIINSTYITYRPLLDSSAPDPAKDLVKNHVAYSRARTLDLWRPEQPILLGCASVTKSVGINDTSVYIDRGALKNAAWGAYSGYALIDSEIIKFDGLELAYTPKSGAPASPQVVKSAEEFQEVVSYASGAVTFTGKLCNVERGQLGTTSAAHTLALTGWTKSPAAKLTKGTAGNGYLQIRSTVNGGRGVAYAVKVLDSDSNWINTRMVIQNAGTKYKSAGVLMSTSTSSSGVTGLYVEVSQGTNSKTGRISVYRVNNSVINKSTLTAPITVDMETNKPFNLSVFYKKLDGPDKRLIRVFIDGERVMTRTLNTNLPLTKKVGLAATGDTSALFDYVYGGRGAGDSDEQTALDGDFKKFFSDVVKRDRGQLPRREIPSLVDVGFERFDDYAREVYVDDVRFTRGPAMNIEYILTSTTVRDRTNTKNVALGSQIGGAVWGMTPFGAVVTVANLSSQPLVVAYVKDGGESTLYPYIYGNIVEEFAETRYEKKQENSIFRNGEKKYEFTSRWVNSRDSAKKLAEFVLARGATAKRTFSLDVWSPHVLQVGDEVRIKIPEKSIDIECVVLSIDKGGEDVVKASIVAVER